MKKLSEEIARSYSTADTDPIQWDHHPELDVEYYANDEGTWSVQVKCVSDPSLSSNLERFPDEASATHFARQWGDRIMRRKINESKYSIFKALYH